LATFATLLLAHAIFAQDTVAPVSAPIITNVTPGDASGVIGFIPSRVTEGTPAVREYVVSCETIGDANAGVIESKFNSQTEVDSAFSHKLFNFLTSTSFPLFLLDSYR
jgi:hypothetical protein